MKLTIDTYLKKIEILGQITPKELFDFCDKNFESEDDWESYKISYASCSNCTCCWKTTTTNGLKVTYDKPSITTL